MNCVRLLSLLAVVCLLAAAPAALATGVRYAGAAALLIEPENSYYGYDFTIQAALMRRGLEVVSAPPTVLADPVKLQPYDLVVTNLKRAFTPEQVAGLKAYVAAGGAVYGNWGGPMSCPELLHLGGLSNAHSVYIQELSLPDSPLTAGLGPQRWVFPQFAGHARLGDKGHEMVAFTRTEGLEVARDAAGHCLGALREVGAGRCAWLGFCPSNYRFLTADSRQADAVLDNLLTWLLPRGGKTRPLPATFQVCLPRGAKIGAVTRDGRPLAACPTSTLGSLVTVTVPTAGLPEGKSTTVQVACTLPAGPHLETWLHDPIASSFNAFAPTEAAQFFTDLRVAVVQPLLRYEGGSCCYLRGLAGDVPRERFAKYPGDLLAEYVQACQARGVKVIGGLYLDWKRFERNLAEAPPFVGKGEAVPERKLGQRLCPLDPEVQEHNLAIIANVLTNYPALDGLILDDNFEFHQRPCHCAACRERFAAACRREGRQVADLTAEADAEGPVWKAFWQGETLAFCKRVHDLCAAHGKPVGGWTGQRGPLAFRGIFDFAGNMVYSEPAYAVAPLFELSGDFPVVTLLWGMDRRPAEMEADVVAAIRAGSPTVGFWVTFNKQAGVTDNPWSLGSQPTGGFTLNPGCLTAIQRSFVAAEQTWRDYYRDHLIRGDARLVVTQAKLEPKRLTVTIKRLAQPTAQRVVGPVDLSGLATQKP